MANVHSNIFLGFQQYGSKYKDEINCDFTRIVCTVMVQKNFIFSELSSFADFFPFFARFHPSKPSTVGVSSSPPRAGQIHRRRQVDVSRGRSLSSPKPGQTVNSVGNISRDPGHELRDDVESDETLPPAGNPQQDRQALDLPVYPESDGASDGGIGGGEPVKGCEGEVERR